MARKTQPRNCALFSRESIDVGVLERFNDQCDSVCRIDAPKGHGFSVFAVFMAGCGAECPLSKTNILKLIGTAHKFSDAPIAVRWEVKCLENNSVLFYLENESPELAREKLSSDEDKPFWIKPRLKTSSAPSPSQIHLRVIRRSWFGRRAIPVSISLEINGVKTKSKHLFINSELVPIVGIDSREEDEDAKSVKSLSILTLGDFRVVGGYYRHTESVLRQLRNLADKIKLSLTTSSKSRRARANYLLWAEPGSGKTGLVREIARALNVNFIEANLAEMNEKEFGFAVNAARNSDSSTLVFIDEIDAKQDAKWPYDKCFSLLDENLKPTRKSNLVVVVAGSTKGGIDAMIDHISNRFKGKDLLTRIADKDSHYIVPAMSQNDRLVVFAGMLNKVAGAAKLHIKDIDRACLYYILKKDSLKNPRQLEEVIRRSVSKVSKGSEMLFYSDLFDRGETEQFDFWVKHLPVMKGLSEGSVSLR